MTSLPCRPGFTWHCLQGGFRFGHVGVPAVPGLLTHLHQPTVVSARGRLLVALSLSAGVAEHRARDILDRAVDQLLDLEDEKREAGAVLASLRAEVWRQFEAVLLERATPSVMAVVALATGVLAVWRAGPNGVALARDGEVRLLSEDLRFGALRRMGVDLTQTSWGLLGDPLLGEVSDLTELEPPTSARQEFLVALHAGASLVLMSRGAFPFAPPAATGAADWWHQDAGWRHGLGADLVAIAHEQGGDEGQALLAAFCSSVAAARDVAT